MVGDEKTQGYVDPNFIKEWEACESIFARFDGYLNDLRKYGFTFITALLAAEFILFPQTSTDNKALPLEIKFAILLVNLVLILTLQILDRNYIVFETAAAARSTILERTLNLELSETISQRYRQSRVDDFVSAIYSAFVVAVIILSGFVLYPNISYIALLVIIGCVVIGVAVYMIKYSIRVKYPLGPIDYTLDRLRYKQGDTIGITLTNLDSSEVFIEPKTVVWKIKQQDGTVVKTEQTGDQSITIKGMRSYTWLWQVEKSDSNEVINEGIYVVYRPTATEKPEELPSNKGTKEKKPILHKLRNWIKHIRPSADKDKNEQIKYIQIIKDKDKETILVPLNRRLRISKAPIPYLTPIPFAVTIKPSYTWDDLVLPANTKEQLREICNYVKQKPTVHEVMGFNKQPPESGKGFNFLFSGLPGTGKTMAASIIASELKFDMYKIDLSEVLSKYIGETEKNLDRIFKAAENSNSILFFDKADTLFGKRTEVRDAHDRYVNIDIDDLIQKMEDHENIVILTANMSKNIDDAFLRRMSFVVDFPFPNEKNRLNIWKNIFPKQSATENIDFRFLAKLEISGGVIRNIALAAAFLAAESSNAISMEHVSEAAKREFQKIGKAYTKEKFSKYYVP